MGRVSGNDGMEHDPHTDLRANPVKRWRTCNQFIGFNIFIKKLADAYDEMMRAKHPHIPVDDTTR